MLYMWKGVGTYNYICFFGGGEGRECLCLPTAERFKHEEIYWHVMQDFVKQKPAPLSSNGRILMSLKDNVTLFLFLSKIGFNPFTAKKSMSTIQLQETKILMSPHVCGGP